MSAAAELHACRYLHDAARQREPKLWGSGLPAVVVPLPSSPKWLVPKPYSAGPDAALAGAASPALARASTPTIAMTTPNPPALIITHSPQAEETGDRRVHCDHSDAE